MSIFKDIKRERVKLVRATFKSKLARRISQDILKPIFDEIEKEAEIILNEAGQRIVDDLIDSINKSGGGGGTYRIYHIDPGAPRGEKIVSGPIPYDSSAPGGPPDRLEGALVRSISFKLDRENGSLEYGVLRGRGIKTFKSYSFFPDPKEKGVGNIYVSINPSDNKKSAPLHRIGSNKKGYSQILDDPSSASYRPWFDSVVENEIRPTIRAFIRERMKEALRKATKRPTVRKAVVFKVYFRDV